MHRPPLVPAKAGTQAQSRTLPSRGDPRGRGDARWFGALAALVATPALAHDGHHETLTLAQQLRHLASEPDHRLAVAGLVVLAVVGTWQWRRAKARK